LGENIAGFGNKLNKIFRICVDMINLNLVFFSRSLKVPMVLARIGENRQTSASCAGILVILQRMGGSQH